MGTFGRKVIGTTVIALLAMGVVFVASGSAEESGPSHVGRTAAATTTITGWTFTDGPAFKTAMTQIVKDFTAAHPQISVKLDYFPTGTAGNGAEKMTAAAAAKSGPDFFQELGSTYSPTLQPVADVPLDSYLKTLPKDVVVPEKLRAETTGKIYEVPWSLQAYSFFYYNKKLLKAAGINSVTPATTFDGLLGVCRKLQQRGMKQPMAVGFADGEPVGLTAWLGGQFLTVKQISAFWAGKIDFTDPRVRKGFTNMKAMVDAGCFGANAGALKFAEATPSFDTGKSAFTMTQFALRGEILAHAKAIGGTQNLGIMALPPEKGTIYGDHPTIDGSSGATWSMTCWTKKRAAVWSFLSYLTTPTAERVMWDKFGQFPNNTSLLKQLADDSANPKPIAALLQLLTSPAVHIGPWVAGPAGEVFTRIGPQWIDGQLATDSLLKQLQSSYASTIAQGKQAVHIRAICK